MNINQLIEPLVSESSLGNEITTLRTSPPTQQSSLHTQSLTSSNIHPQLNENHGRKLKRRASEISEASSSTLQSCSHKQPHPDSTQHTEPDENRRRSDKKQQSWTAAEDALIIKLRETGMKWDDVAKRVPGRSSISCRLRYQNYLEKEILWDSEKKNKMARLYDRLKSEMWQKVAMEMQMPWRAVESVAWQLGQQELSVRANAPTGPTLFCSCGCDGFVPFGQRNPAFSGALPAQLCYICGHELKAHDAMVVNLQQGGVVSAVLTQVYFARDEPVPKKGR